MGSFGRWAVCLACSRPRYSLGPRYCAGRRSAYRAQSGVVPFRRFPGGRCKASRAETHRAGWIRPAPPARRQPSASRQLIGAAAWARGAWAPASSVRQRGTLWSARPHSGAMLAYDHDTATAPVCSRLGRGRRRCQCGGREYLLHVRALWLAGAAAGQWQLPKPLPALPALQTRGSAAGRPAQLLPGRDATAWFALPREKGLATGACLPRLWAHPGQPDRSRHRPAG